MCLLSVLLGIGVPVIEGSLASGSGRAMVRPESVTVAVDGTANGSVVSVNFLGSISRVYVQLDAGQGDDEQLMAQVPSSLAVRLSPGDRVRVGVEATPLLVVAD